MNKETYEALNNVIKESRFLLGEKYAKRKRLSLQEVGHKATTIRDIVAVESWLDKVAKKYE